MNTVNFKLVITAVLLLFLSTACSKKLMPPEIGASSEGDVETTTVAGGDSVPVEEQPIGGTGGSDGGTFAEEPIFEGMGSGSSMGTDGTSGGTGSGTGIGGDNFASNSGPGGDAGSSMSDFGSGSQANIGNGSDGFFEGSPFSGSGGADGGNGFNDGHGHGSSGGSTGMNGGSGSSGTDVAALRNVYVETSDLKDIHFRFDQYDLDSNSKQVLQQNAEFLKKNPGMRIEIQGHCDERGTNNYNIALGERRAHSTKKFLVSQGIDSSRVNVISYGEEKPFCFDSNESCWHQNRRAHFMVAR